MSVNDPMFFLILTDDDTGERSDEGRTHTREDAVRMGGEIAMEYGFGDREDAEYDLEKYGFAFADPYTIHITKS